MANKLFQATLYDVSESRKDEWERMTDAYVVAQSLEKATLIAKANTEENQIVTGIRELTGSKFFE
jgi:hypothetical protein